jgi:hypothetical protein
LLWSSKAGDEGGEIMATQLTTISPSKPVNHYRAYKPRPFKREERDKVTILYGGLTWKHERLLQGALHNLKYKAEPLPNITREDLDAGKELIDVGACCPTIFTTGSLVNLLKKKVAAQGKDEVNDKYIFLTAVPVRAVSRVVFHGVGRPRPTRLSDVSLRSG